MGEKEDGNVSVIGGKLVFYGFIQGCCILAGLEKWQMSQLSTVQAEMHSHGHIFFGLYGRGCRKGSVTRGGIEWPHLPRSQGFQALGFTSCPGPGAVVSGATLSVFIFL